MRTKMIAIALGSFSHVDVSQNLLHIPTIRHQHQLGNVNPQNISELTLPNFFFSDSCLYYHFRGHYLKITILKHALNKVVYLGLRDT